MARKFTPPSKIAPSGVTSVDVTGAHTHSSNHRADLNRSTLCGCFYCLSTYTPDAIETWVDDLGGEYVTAVCPRCGIDSVIGTASGYPIERWFLERMHERWFSYHPPPSE